MKKAAPAYMKINRVFLKCKVCGENTVEYEPIAGKLLRQRKQIKENYKMCGACYRKWLYKGCPIGGGQSRAFRYFQRGDILFGQRRITVITAEGKHYEKVRPFTRLRRQIHG